MPMTKTHLTPQWHIPTMVGLCHVGNLLGNQHHHHHHHDMVLPPEMWLKPRKSGSTAGRLSFARRSILVFDPFPNSDLDIVFDIGRFSFAHRSLHFWSKIQLQLLKFLFRDNDVDVVVVQDGEENGAPGGGFNQAEDNSQVGFYFSPHLDPDADFHHCWCCH